MRIAQPNRNNYQASLNLRQEADGVFFLLTYAFLVKACSYEDHRRCITMFQSGQDSSEKRREGQLRGLQPKWWKCDNKQRRWPHTAVWHARWKVSGSHCRQYTVYDKYTVYCDCIVFLCCPCAFLRCKSNLFSKKYGVDLIRYTHGDTNTVIYSSNKLDGKHLTPCTAMRIQLVVHFGKWNIFWDIFQIPSDSFRSLTTSTSDISQVTLRGA